MKKLPSRRLLLPLLIPFLAAALLFILARCLTGPDIQNREFQKFTEDFFGEEICSTTINLHYTLADPGAAGIRDYPITLGSIDLTSSADPALRELETFLKDQDPEVLTKENQRILKLMKDDAQNREDLSRFGLIQEVLSPSLGVQAQLPVLLCEYTFRSRQDILDYLGLLKELPQYFSQILAFEQTKSQAGYFMNDTAAEGVIDQCSAFLEHRSPSVLDSSFRRRLEEFPGLSREEQAACLAVHQKLLETCVYPAYQSLIDGLDALRGTGKNPGGLAGFPEGKDYYRWLLRSQVGTLDTPEQIRRRLLLQLQTDAREMQALLSQNPSLLTQESSFPQQTPEEILDTLRERMKEDFPELQAEDCEVKYVDESLEDYLSPAFYLTPPADTNSPNSIYINRASRLEGIELFTTLAHEGFPGHLYQTVYFSSTHPPLIRSLYEPGGYVEGWATYIESFAYSYAEADPDLTRLLWLNRSLNLCLYSLLDLGIHYDGWNQEEVSAFLEPFGITDPELIGDIFQYIIETPANYLKYYYGYLSFLDIRQASETQLGDSFNLKEFHRQILDLGPMPFYLLEEELGLTA